MGLADRGYYRDEPKGFGSGGGPGGFRFRQPSAWSVTTWLIVINVSVFLLDTFMAKQGVPVLRATEWSVPQPPASDDQAVSKAYFGIDTQTGQAIETESRVVGMELFRVVVDETTDTPVGRKWYIVQHPLQAFGHFSTYQGFYRLEVWRLVTFQFLHDHGSIWHLAMNMFGLFMFGSIVEEQLGRKRYLAFYLVCGIFGGLLYLLLNLAGGLLQVQMPPLLFSSPHTPLIGASAGVYGVIMACACIVPTMRVSIFFLPFTFTMRTVAYAWVALSAFNLLIGGDNAGGDAAHIGGALAGAYFIRNSHLLLDFFDVFGDSRKGPSRKGLGKGKARSIPAKKSKPVKPPREVQQRQRDEAEIDSILDKIQAQGIGSLSEREKKMLAKDTERKRQGEG